MSLTDFGWNQYFQEEFNKINRPDLNPGRVTCRQKNTYYVECDAGVHKAEISGKFYFETVNGGEFPAVGDWVTVSGGNTDDASVIHHVLPRTTCISRTAAGTSGKLDGRGPLSEQVIAANVDIVFIVAGLDRDYNLRRIERYLAGVYSSGAQPVILLNKADLNADADELQSEVEANAFGVPVHVISAKGNSGLEFVSGHLEPGGTAAFMGSSGVGKSTIINALIGYDRQKTLSVSSSVHKGVHTTTHRELILLDSGGLVLDNPGMRELRLWDADDGVTHLFQDIEELSRNCRFSDCRHEHEPGCAVKEAIENGDLDRTRLNSYLKLKREEAFHEDRQHMSADAIEKDKWKKIAMFQRHLKKR